MRKYRSLFDLCMVREGQRNGKTVKITAMSYLRPCDDREQRIDRWMDYYNTERYQRQLAKLSPDEFYEFITTGAYPLPCAVPKSYPGGSAP